MCLMTTTTTTTKGRDSAAGADADARDRRSRRAEYSVGATWRISRGTASGPHQGQDRRQRPPESLPL